MAVRKAREEEEMKSAALVVSNAGSAPSNKAADGTTLESLDQADKDLVMRMREKVRALFARPPELRASPPILAGKTGRLRGGVYRELPVGKASLVMVVPRCCRRTWSCFLRGLGVRSVALLRLLYIGAGGQRPMPVWPG